MMAKTFEELLDLVTKHAEKHMGRWLETKTDIIKRGECTTVPYYDGYLSPRVEVGYNLDFQPVSGGTPVKEGSVVLCTISTEEPKVLLVTEVSKDGRKFKVEDYKKTPKWKITEWIDFDRIHGVSLTATWYDYEQAEKDDEEGTYEDIEDKYTRHVTF